MYVFGKIDKTRQIAKISGVATHCLLCRLLPGAARYEVLKQPTR